MLILLKTHCRKPHRCQLSQKSESVGEMYRSHYINDNMLFDNVNPSEMNILKLDKLWLTLCNIRECVTGSCDSPVTCYGPSHSMSCLVMERVLLSDGVL